MKPTEQPELPGNDLKERVEYFADWDYNIKIAGVKFRQTELDELYEANWNDVQVRLEPEPTNAFDPNAIKIYASLKHVGYIPATVAEPLNQLIKDGHEYECALIYITNNHQGKAAGKGGKGIRTAKIALKEK